MKNIHFAIAMFIAMSFFTACSKDSKDDPISNASSTTSNTPTTSSASNSGTTSGNGSYYPLAVGNTWIYSVTSTSSKGVISSSFKDTVKIISTKLINGITYFNEVETTSKDAISIFGNDANGNIVSLVNLNSSNTWEVDTIIPANPLVNKTWGAGTEKIISLTASQNNYTNLLEISMTYNWTTSDLGSIVLPNAYYLYFKKGIGLVYCKQINSDGSTTEQSLISYTLK